MSTPDLTLDKVFELTDRAVVLSPTMASLARELAHDIFAPEEILPRYGFHGPDDPKWLALQRSHDFIALITQAIREWNTADSTPKRIRYKALASMELMIVELHMIAMTHPSAERRLEAMKLMKSIAGFDANGSALGLDPGAGRGSGVSINITIGSRKVSAHLATTIEGSVVTETKGSDGLGESADGVVEGVGEGLILTQVRESVHPYDADAVPIGVGAKFALAETIQDGLAREGSNG